MSELLPDFDYLIVAWSEDADCYIARIPDLGIQAWGGTVEEATREALEAWAACAPQLAG